ncbi:hypothetical protein JVU11DRAFT_11311 [Chiua virens]|nr:hypothetical protein JVU11DRAFT_11311 [Chiua virens]
MLVRCSYVVHWRSNHVYRQLFLSEQPYVEEWEVPPVVDESWTDRAGGEMDTWAIGVVIKKALLLSLSLYSSVGTVLAAGIKAVGSAHLYETYFKAKKMTPHEIAMFIEERKWDY